MFFQTGIDRGAGRTKKVCVFALPPLSYYRLVGETERGKRIHVIPSHRVLLKNLPEELKDMTSARQYVEETFLSLFKDREVLWKIWWDEGRPRVLLAEPDGKLPKGSLWDAEPVALTRAFLSLGLKDGEVWDFGKIKITRVKIKKGRLFSFRVFWEIPKEEFHLDENTPVLLSGGKSQSEEVLKLFKKTEPKCIKTVPPEKVTAFGAALWGVLGRGLPSFHSPAWEIPPQTLKKLSLCLILSLAFMSLLWGGLDFWTLRIKQALQIKEREIFKSFYPRSPVVFPLNQVKVMIEEANRPRFYELLKELLSSLPPSAKIFSLNYDGVNLRLKAEVPEGTSKNLPGQIASVKKLPGGTEIVEIVFPSGKKQ